MEREPLRGWRLWTLLAAPAVLAYAPLVAGLRALYHRDVGLSFFPHKALIAQALREGRLLQWTPAEFGGLPLFVDPNFNPLHPLQWICDLLPPAPGFALFCALHAAAAALGAGALARALGLSRPAALLAGWAYAWSGSLVSLQDSGQLVAPCILPWVCAAAVWLERERTLGAAALAAVAAALTFVAGTPEIGGCAFALGALLALAGPARTLRQRIGSFALFAGAVALGALIAAVQLWPMLLYLRGSTRGAGFDLAQAGRYSLHPLRLPGIAVPFFAGDVDAPGLATWIPGGEAVYVQEIYAGAAVLLFAALGLRAAREPRLQAARSRALWLLASASLLLLLALGRHSPLHQALWSALPLLRAVRFPEKWVVPLALPIALLAALGLERFAEQMVARGPLAVAAVARRPLAIAALATALAAAAAQAMVLAGWAPFAAALGEARAECLRATALPSMAQELALLAAGLALLWARGAGRIEALRAQALAIALVAVELALPAARLLHTLPAADVWPDPALAAALEADAAAPRWSFRYDVESGLTEADLARLPPEWGARAEKIFRARRLGLFGAAPALLGMLQARGYASLTPAGSRALYQHPDARAVLQILGVRYFIEIGTGRMEQVPRDWPVLVTAAGGLVRVRRNPAARPMLQLYGQALVDAAPTAPLRCGGRPIARLSPADAHALPAGMPTAGECNGLAARDPAEGSQAAITRFEPERVEAEVDARAPALAVLAHNWDEGWSLSIDGAPAPSLQAYGALRAAPVAAGKHSLVWTYRTPGLAAGAWLSLVGLALLAAALAFGRKVVGRFW